MRLSELFGKTQREIPSEADTPSHQLLLRAGWGTLRRRSFLASLHGQSLMELLVEGLLGTREITQNRTGCTPRQPLFWFHHLLGLPVKRTLKFWRFRR